jgi:hypothetical protein
LATSPRSSADPEASLVVETYNVEEGTGLDRLRLALRAAFASAGGTALEVLLADVSPGARVGAAVASEFPDLVVVAAPGATYDGAKAAAARAARGRFVAYLDADCRPDPGWLERLLAPLRRGEAVAVGGFTRYEGGFLAAVESVLDFGFLLPRRRRPVGCYASNNSAFLRDALLACPVPDGPLRCHCYAHAQRLLRSGRPVLLVPDAACTHELPPFFRERVRRGRDLVVACRVDPALPEARFLRWGPLGAFRFYGANVRLDWRRLALGGRDAGLRAWQVPLAALAVPLVRLVDLVGIAAALAFDRPVAPVGDAVPAP